MRIYCATMIHESSSFSPIPTSIESFRESVLYRPSTGEGARHLGQVLAGVDLENLVRSRGHEPIVGLIANAEPSAPPRTCDYELLSDEIVENLRKSLPVDAVFLFLHGAQMAQGVDDCESDLLVRVRRTVGAGVPIAVELDLHCNVGEATLQCADIVLACLEYPHVDFESRAHLALKLLERTVNKEIQPSTVMQRIPMLGLYPTTVEPMRGFVDSISAREGSDGILAISLGHGFTGADTPLTGASVMVVSDRRREQATALARSIAQEFWSLRERLDMRRSSSDEVLKRALMAAGGPVIIADAADNPGGGAAGDATYMLTGLLRLKVENAALGMIWDPLAAMLAAKAGVGSRIALRLGGKTGRASGPPCDVEALVEAINPDARQRAQGEQYPLGLTVALDIDGLKVVVNSLRQQVFSPECFTSVGIDPARMRVVVVKSAQHFVETFGPMAAEILYADAPAGYEVDYRSYRYRRVLRPVWPLDPGPIHAFDQVWS